MIYLWDYPNDYDAFDRERSEQQFTDLYEDFKEGEETNGNEPV